MKRLHMQRGSKTKEKDTENTKQRQSNINNTEREDNSITSRIRKSRIEYVKVEWRFFLLPLSPIFMKKILFTCTKSTKI
jgi:hypothetical protein